MTNALQKWVGFPTEKQTKETQQEASMRDFERVICILSSCVHEAHIQTADKCFDVFKNKWQSVSKEIMDYNYSIYRRERSRVYSELERKRESVGLLLS